MAAAAKPLVKTWTASKATGYMLSAGLVPVYVSYDGKILSDGWDSVTVKESEKYAEDFLKEFGDTPLLNAGLALTEASGLLGIAIEYLDTQIEKSQERQINRVLEKEGTTCVKYEPYFAYIFKRDAKTDALVDLLKATDASVKILERDFIPFLGTGNWHTGSRVSIVNGFERGELSFKVPSDAALERLGKAG